MIVSRLFVPAMLALLVVAPATAASAASVQVPFVGCPSDGQIGPEPAPKGSPKTVQLDPKIAARLSFYQSKYDAGILAPRGWRCIALEGSDGSNLFVMPQARSGADMLGEAALKGPAIELALSLGETSGRFAVAEVAARYFPKQAAFVRGVVAEGIEPASDFPAGPYAGDRTVTQDDRRVVVDTPPLSAHGLGTAGRLAADALPLRTVAIIEGNPPNLMTLRVKLPPEMQDLLPVLAGQLH